VEPGGARWRPRRRRFRRRWNPAPPGRPRRRGRTPSTRRNAEIDNGRSEHREQSSQQERSSRDVKGYVRRDEGAAERGGDTGGVGGEGAVHGAELRLQRLRRAGHVRVERQVGRGRAQPPEPSTARGGSGSGARARPRRGGRHRLGGSGNPELGWLARVGYPRRS
jgi:hypothetical protein